MSESAELPITETELRYVRLIASGMFRRFRGVIPYEDLLAEGNLALVESASRYVPGGPAALKTYCDKHVRGAMFRYAAKELDRRRPILYGDWVFSESDDDEPIEFEETIADDRRVDPLVNIMADRACCAVARGSSRPCPYDSRSQAEKNEKKKKVSVAIKLFVMQSMPRAEVAALLGVGEVRVWKYVKEGLELARRAIA